MENVKIRMYIYKVLSAYCGLNAGDYIMINYSCHNCVVRLGDGHKKTLYLHGLKQSEGLTYNKVLDLCGQGVLHSCTKNEVLKLLPHATKLVWQNFLSYRYGEFSKITETYNTKFKLTAWAAIKNPKQ